LSDFLEEQKWIEERIWSLAQIKCGMKVLDVGIGENAHSTKKLIGLGALVTAMDTDSKTLNKHKNPKINLVQGGASQLPRALSKKEVN
jgi:ubiquinone/menaquinone biosynthesis C-methylase UbiE